MTDLISRQAAIDAMNARLEDIKLTWRGKVKKGEIAMYLDMRGVIEILPSAEPVHHGKWVPKYIRICGQDWASGMKCSECGEDALNAEGNEFLTDYCPNCGARMDRE